MCSSECIICPNIRKTVRSFFLSVQIYWGLWSLFVYLCKKIIKYLRPHSLVFLYLFFRLYLWVIFADCITECNNNSVIIWHCYPEIRNKLHLEVKHTLRMIYLFTYMYVFNCKFCPVISLDYFLLRSHFRHMSWWCKKYLSRLCAMWIWDIRMWKAFLV